MKTSYPETTTQPCNSCVRLGEG